MSETFSYHKFLASRVQQTFTGAVGKGNVTVGSAVSGYVTMNSIFSVGQFFYYSLYGGLAWENGIGKFVTSTVMERTIVLESSNGGDRLTLHPSITYVLECGVQPDAFLDDEENIFKSVLPSYAVDVFQTVSDTGYFVYVGRGPTEKMTAAWVFMQVTTAGAGAQVADVGVFSSPNAPNKTAQSLTKIETTSSVTSLTTTGVKSNVSIFTSTMFDHKHYWIGLRTQMATTQPIFVGLTGDMTQGYILVKTTCGAFASLGATFTTSLPTINQGTIAPDIRWSSL